ncbi:TRAP transporter large permease [Mailhella sp.]|uniref:TRAP transporter large permease n=1 Tax=Mailhella sp. TaxID=1981029 RepID=UPI003AB192BB
MTGFLLLLSIAFFLFFRVPIAIAIGLTAISYLLITGAMPLGLATMASFSGIDSFALLAVPFFVLAGQIMARGGIAKHLLILADELLGALPGGYALSTILASVFFADLSGSAPATVAAIGTLMVPAMHTQKYRLDFAAAVCACAGCISVIIPPSNPMVIYGVAGNVSIGRLFLAGIIPGALVAIALMIPAYFISKKHGWRGNPTKRSAGSLLRAFNQAKWALLVPVIIMGGIYGGIFTPTESAAVASLYALIVGLFIYKEFTWREIPSLFRAAAMTVAPLLLIVGMATFFGQLISLLGIPMKMAKALTSLTSNPILLMLLINLFLLFVGMIMETVAAIVLLTPILLPLVVQLGFDPVHFGIIMIVNLSVGFITPPLGVNLFVANTISDVPSERIFAASIPFVISMLITLTLLIVFPQLTLWLPDLYFQ